MAPAAALAVAGPGVVGDGPAKERRGRGRGGLGGNGVHAAGHEAEAVGEGEEALTGLERADGVPGVPQDGLRYEPVGAGDEVVVRVVVGHAEALGRAAQRRGGGRREVELGAVAELGGQLERLRAAGELREADAVRVRLLILLQHHFHFLLSDLPGIFFWLPSCVSPGCLA